MKKLLQIIALLALIAGGVGYYMYNKPHKDMEDAKADISLTATELFKAFEADEAKANGNYLDKVIVVKGIVQDVSKDEEGNTSLTLESEGMFGVICKLDNLAEHKRTEFKTGEEVIFKGICTGVLMDVVLVRCVEQD